MKTRVEDLLNDELFSYCKKHPFLALRRSIDITTSTDGVILPSTLVDVRRVRNATTSEEPYEVFRRDKKDLDPRDRGYRYYTEAYGDEPADYAADVAIDKGATTFTSSTITDDHTGKYIRFGEEPGLYLLTAAKTFEPAYYGPKLEEGECVICPKETQRLFLVDEDEEVTTDLSTLRVYYWVLPQPLYNDSDTSPLPLDDILELRVLRGLPEARDRRPVSKKEIEEAWADCQSADPAWLFDEQPRSRAGVRFDASSSDMFLDRSNAVVRDKLPWE